MSKANKGRKGRHRHAGPKAHGTPKGSCPKCHVYGCHGGSECTNNPNGPLGFGSPPWIRAAYLARKAR